MCVTHLPHLFPRLGKSPIAKAVLLPHMGRLIHEEEHDEDGEEEEDDDEECVFKNEGTV